MRTIARIAVLFAFVTLVSCNDSSPPASPVSIEVTDAQLYEMQGRQTGWVFFGFSQDTLTRGGNSAHEPRLLVRYNAAAATQLDAQGRIRAGAEFPDSSLIVKDLFTGSVRTTIAYMFKLRRATNAAPGGWIWAETDGQGIPRFSASRKGEGCINCHSVGIDYTRMNDAHP